MIQIAISNESTVIPDNDVLACLAALQIQVNRDFAPLWGISAQLSFLPKGQSTSGWQLIVFDTSDQADALGYHELTSTGQPLGKIFAKSDIQAGTSWTVTASHELLEMLVDPWINLTAESDGQDGSITLYAYECSDAVEADALGYKIGDVLVSDFVLPAWFQPLVPGPYSFRKSVTAPFQLAPGGYISILQAGSGVGWQQVTAQLGRRGLMSLAPGGPDAPQGSRRQRRLIPDANWRRSER